MKIGDRVRFVTPCSGSNAKLAGAAGAIIKNSRRSGFDYAVRLDERHSYGHTCDDTVPDGYGRFANAADLEYVVAPATTGLRIEAGKFYKTRDGRKVGPMVRNDEGYWTPDNGRSHYRDNGVRRFGGDEETYLIAEWVDETAFKVGDIVTKKFWPESGYAVKRVTANKIWLDDTFGGTQPYNLPDEELRLVAPATSGKPAFKVGDRVRATKPDVAIRSGEFYVIAAIDEGDKYMPIKVIDDDGDGFWLTKGGFEVVAPQPAIVCLIENGQPKPATRPYVHGSRESAVTEANRLAGQHKGQEFGVYELVSTAKQERVYDHQWQNTAKAGLKIEAIKQLRAVAGLPLATAKTAVEDWLTREAA